MAQAFSRRSVTEEAQVRSLVIPYKICGGQSGTGTNSPTFSVFPCQYRSTVDPYSHSITWRLNSWLVGGRSSETSFHHIDMNNNNNSRLLTSVII
jgi:hypothetical protein